MVYCLFVRFLYLNINIMLIENIISCFELKKNKFHLVNLILYTQLILFQSYNINIEH